ncbi:hypothetical protein QFZ62_000850 [Clavibacter sp. B3I6]|nr:hypothetical protein [Clavibacter sp. B3I6]
MPVVGRLPLPMELNSAGRPEMVPPVRSTSATPRNTSMPASVTMNAGMPTNATQKPCQAPMSAPTTSDSATAAPHGRPHSFMLSAATAPTVATTEPTDRSMWPAMITMTMPIARISTYAFCWMRFATLPG